MQEPDPIDARRPELPDAPPRTRLCRHLLLARRHLPFWYPWQCRRCDYPLVGLSTPRCPECGTPFNPILLAGVVPPGQAPEQ